jgi:UDP-N-acetylmuramate dehydrogenase
MMMEYPQYRMLEGTDALYAIEGPRHAVEFQPLGSTEWLIHAHFASDYPRFVWLQDLREEVAQSKAISKEQFFERVNARTVRESSSKLGRFNARATLETLTLESNVELKSLTTFGVASSAHHHALVCSDDEVRQAIMAAEQNGWELLVLGGGSNMLLHSDWEGMTLQQGIKGIELINDDGNCLEVVVGAGESWHDWVLHAVERGWNGVENLALIPGSVGASPMQNIGAYGVEVKDHFLWLEAVNRKTGELQRFDHAACEFGYRESIFKQRERNLWVIVRVAFALERNAPLHMEYGAIQSELHHLAPQEITHKDVSEAVMRIRRSKLPDPAELGNAGSFFKNPILHATAFQEVLSNHPNVVHYPLEDGSFKLAAGWLIEQAGWKGKRRGNCGVHDKQALVLVNYGEATGQEIWKLAKDIIQDVRAKFGVELQPEVNQIRVS